MKADELPYLEPYNSNVFQDIGISFGTWFLIMMNLVPISLLVTLEMVKFFQGWWIEWDWRMVCPDTGIICKVQSSALNEQLGMVHFIFSDKTGTLTKNIMDFKRFTAGAICYGKNDPKQLQYPPGITNVNFEDDAAFQDLENVANPNHNAIWRLREALGLCHTCIVEKKVDEKTQKEYIVYNASSPDELALVNGARHLGFEFTERDEDSNMIIKLAKTGESLSYTLLHVIEFDSARKRMTVVVRTPDKQILVICKGADSIIEKRLAVG